MFTRGPYRRNVLALLFATLVSCVGCNAFRETVPANCFPALAEHPRESRRPIDYALLRQSRPPCISLAQGTSWASTLRAC